MKFAKILVSLSLAALFMVTASNCSVFSSAKSSKNDEPKKAKAESPTPPSPVEWKERKWENYGEERSGTTYYFERESISYPARNIIRVWKKRTLAGSARSLKEITSYDEMDCKTEKYRTLELQGVNADDTKTEIFRKPGPWNTVYQDSADEYFLRKFCREAAQAGSPDKK
jgi:hypothetical protein